MAATIAWIDCACDSEFDNLTDHERQKERQQKDSRKTGKRKSRKHGVGTGRKEREKTIIVAKFFCFSFSLFTSFKFGKESSFLL